MVPVPSYSARIIKDASSLIFYDGGYTTRHRGGVTRRAAQPSEPKVHRVRPAAHLFIAFAIDTKLVLAHLDIDATSNANPAARALLANPTKIAKTPVVFPIIRMTMMLLLGLASLNDVSTIFAATDHEVTLTSTLPDDN